MVTRQQGHVLETQPWDLTLNMLVEQDYQYVVEGEPLYWDCFRVVSMWRWSICGD